MSKLFKDLKKGLKEALDHAKGKISLKSEMIEIIEPQTDKIHKPNAKTKKAIRNIKQQSYAL